MLADSFLTFALAGSFLTVFFGVFTSSFTSCLIEEVDFGFTVLDALTFLSEFEVLPNENQNNQ